MRLYHTTDRASLPAILSGGLRDGEGGFVFLTDGLWSWHQNWMLAPGDFDALGANEAVLAYDIPDGVLAAYPAVTASPLRPGDPDYDPELDEPDEFGPDIVWREWHIPAAVVNPYFAGVVHGPRWDSRERPG